MVFCDFYPATGGDAMKRGDYETLRDAMRLGGYPSTRGNLKFNNNHFPIQNFYLRKAVKDTDGSYTTKIIDTVFTNYGDNYAKECPMNW